MSQGFPTPMHEAIELARAAIGLTDPNPRVGCVLVAPDGRVIGRGHTQQVGGPHAEVMALRDALARGESARGATAHVTLEPCAHHGRTPPCCDALIEAGVARVVMALEDPFPLVAGQGAARLRAAGIEVIEGELASEAHELNIGFFSRVRRGRPWVRLKAAISLDGRTALNNGISQWITGPAARADGHAYRKRAGAVLTGVGTVLDDDPRASTCAWSPTVHASRCASSSIRGSTHRRARAFSTPPGRVLVYTAAAADEARAAPPSSKRARAEIAPMLPSPRGKVDLVGDARRSRAAAASTSCMSRPATSSMAPSCAKAWSTSCFSTSPRASSAKGWRWPLSAR